MGLELMVAVRVDFKPMSEIGTGYYHVGDSATPWRARRHTGKRNLGRNDNASEEPYEKGIGNLVWGEIEIPYQNSREVDGRD